MRLGFVKSPELDKTRDRATNLVFYLMSVGEGELNRGGVREERAVQTTPGDVYVARW